MRILRGLLVGYLLVTWAACAATYAADLQEGLLIALVPVVAPLVLNGRLPLDDDNLAHLTAVALLALLQAAVVYLLALAARSMHAPDADTP